MIMTKPNQIEEEEKSICKSVDFDKGFFAFFAGERISETK
jgi:hypothetical protein